MPRTPICLFLAALAPATLAQDAALAPRWRPTEDLPVRVHAGQDPCRWIVKLRDDCGASAADGRFSGRPSPWLRAVEEHASRHGVSDVTRLFPLDDALLDALRSEGERRSGRELADLTQFYVWTVREGTTRPEAEQALRELCALDGVEEAYARPLPAPLPGGGTPSFEGAQDYREAGGGIDADYAETVPGGDGAHITICDLEYSWNLKGLFGEPDTHEDLVGLDGQSPAPAVGPTAAWSDPFNDTDHGTAVAGILVGDANAHGVRGIARGATLRVNAVNTTNGRNVALAILRAVSVLRSGDVILIEQQDFGPNYDFNASPPSQFGLLPVEYYSAEFHAIRQATALCIHVVEAAGNGSQDLDDGTGGGAGCPGVCTGDPSYPLLFDRARRDSGALLVGSATADASHGRTWSTNHGRRIDAWSWGEHVVTLGYGDLFAGGGGAPDEDRLYTQTFGGTSAASAIVAGAAASLSGVHRDRQRHTPLQPFAMRQLMRSVGTLSLGTSRHSWSKQPDLRLQLPLLAQGRDPSTVFPSPSSQGLMGQAFEPLGDVDGDGVGDFLISAHREANVAAWNAGAAYVCSGLDGRALRVHRGQAINEYLAFDLTVLGDVTGDGVAEYLVPSPGLATEVLRCHDGATGNVVWSITQGQGAFGMALAGVGDVNGDAVPDFVVGDFIANSGAGYVDVRSGAGGAWIATIQSPSVGSAFFGYTLAAVGDVDGDGVTDFAVGAPRDDTAGTDAGAVHLYSGATRALVFTVLGDAAGDWLGFAAAGAGDVDGDGLSDVLVGAPRHDAGGTDAGRARVLKGTNGAPLFTFDGLAPGDELGTSVAGLGDLDGDGRAEIALGAPLADTSAGPDAGAVYVYRGARATLMWTYQGENAGDQFGATVRTAGDHSGDGLPDMHVAAPLHGGGAGRSMIFLAPPRKRLQGQAQSQ